MSPSPRKLSKVLPFCVYTGNLQYVLPHINNQNCLKNRANTSNPCCSFHDLLVSRFIYLGVCPESEGIPHSFKIKLTRGKTCPFLRRGAEQVRPCVGAASALSLTSLQAEPKHPGGSTLHISPLQKHGPWKRSRLSRFAGKRALNNAVQVSCGLLYQLCLKPSLDLYN